MSTTAARRACCVCNKDVSGVPHVKDILDNYYCEPCHTKGLKETATATPAARPAPIVSAAAPRPAATSSKMPSGGRASAPATARRAAAPVASTAAKAPTALPDECPNCGTPVIGNRKMCVRCHQDVTQMTKVIARKQQAEKSDGMEVAANVFGTAMRVVGGIVCIGIVVFIGVGVWMMIKPVNPFEDYPTTRMQAVKSFLADIATGTDKGYEKAFELVSFRERTTNNPEEDKQYKAMYARMHDAFVTKYGPDWLSLITVENPDPTNTEDTVPYLLHIGQDVYHITTQAQISVEQATLNLTIRRDKPHYPEDGKRRFGVLELAEYQVHDRSTMIDRAGPGRPEPLPDPKDFRNLQP